MVAYLLQCEYHLQDESLTLEQLRLVVLINAFYHLHALPQHLPVDGSLLRREHGELVLLNLVGQVADDLLVGFQPSHHHRSCDPSEPFSLGRVAFVLYGSCIILVERLYSAEIALVGEVHDAPVF